MKIGLRSLYKKVGVIVVSIVVLLGIGIAARTMSVNNTTNQAVSQQSEQLPVEQLVVKQTLIEPQSSSGGKLSLEAIHALALDSQAGASSKVVRGGNIMLLQSDRFTQSQAHMSLPEIKKLITAEYTIKPYQKMIDAIVDREKQYKDDCYVFYHGMDNSWRVPQDLYTRLYWHFKKLPAELMKSFIFLRFEDVSGPSVVQSFLINKLKEGGLINDHELGNFLFAANIALFGNVGVRPECTWQYFVKSRGHSVPSRAIYEKILNTFGLSKAYIKELMALGDLYKTNEQTIIQLFVPKNRVDEIGYLSWIKGIPAHKKTMDMVLRSVDNKTFPKTAPAIVHYAESFKKEQENNPIFKNLIERVNAGDFSLSYFLKFYCNRPEAIEGINSFQARLIFTPGVLLNPMSGVKIFRYSAATPEQLNNYERKFQEIFKKIVAEKK